MKKNGLGVVWLYAFGFIIAGLAVTAIAVWLLINQRQKGTDLMNQIGLWMLPLVGLGAFAFGVYIMVALIKEATTPMVMSVIRLNGQEYPIHQFDQVNDLICSDKRAAAVIELNRLTGLSYDDAMQVVDNWCTYYY